METLLEVDIPEEVAYEQSISETVSGPPSRGSYGTTGHHEMCYAIRPDEAVIDMELLSQPEVDKCVSQLRGITEMLSNVRIKMIENKSDVGAMGTVARRQVLRCNRLQGNIERHLNRITVDDEDVRWNRDTEVGKIEEGLGRLEDTMRRSKERLKELEKKITKTGKKLSKQADKTLASMGKNKVKIKDLEEDNKSLDRDIDAMHDVVRNLDNAIRTDSGKQNKNNLTPSNNPPKPENAKPPEPPTPKSAPQIVEVEDVPVDFANKPHPPNTSPPEINISPPSDSSEESSDFEDIADITDSVDEVEKSYERNRDAIQGNESRLTALDPVLEEEDEDYLFTSSSDSLTDTLSSLSNGTNDRHDGDKMSTVELEDMLRRLSVQDTSPPDISKLNVPQN